MTEPLPPAPDKDTGILYTIRVICGDCNKMGSLMDGRWCFDMGEVHCRECWEAEAHE